MNSKFKVDPNKLNPKFDGYKLSPFNESENAFRSSLFEEGNIQIQKPPSDIRLGFRELQARIRYSQLIYGYPLDQNRGSAFCIDDDFNLHMITFDKVTKETRFNLITQLIKPLGNLPSFSEPDKGVPVEPELATAVAVSRELVLASNGEGDIELIGIEEKDGKICGASLGSVCYTGTGSEGIQPVPCVLLAARQFKTHIQMIVYSQSTAGFNVATLVLDLPTDTTERHPDGTFILLLQTLHIQTGPQVPFYAAITPTGQTLLGTETRYDRPIQPIQPNPTQYRWTQEADQITIQFDLTGPADINCKFLLDHLSLLVKGSTICYPFRKLWSTIKPDESFWNVADNVLNLYLTKADRNTRWPQLFDHDDGVLESIAPEALEEIKNRMAKFTSDEAPVNPVATDMDEDIDGQSQPVVLSVFGLDGRLVDELSSINHGWISGSYMKQGEMPLICLESDVDGVVFRLDENAGLIEANHVGTLHAFGFVQASKRDARFTSFDPNLQFATIVESSRNVYIYYQHEDKRTIEKQTLVDITKGHDVNIIGAQLLLDNIFMILTESEIVVLNL